MSVYDTFTQAGIALHKMLLLPTTSINKLYNSKHNEFDACASITKPLTTFGGGRS